MPASFRLRTALHATLCAALIGALLSAAGPATAFTCGSWEQFARDDPGTSFDLLSAVDARTPTDGWAVGWYAGPYGPTGFTQQWDGKGWTRHQTPDLTNLSEYLNGVAAVGDGDAWAVGMTLDTPVNYGTLIEHWNGSAWSQVATPALPTDEGGVLNGVSAVPGTNELWAVGYHSQPQMARDTLIEHYDGASWEVIPSPNPGDFSNELLAVSAVSTDDVWAVGYQIDFTFVKTTATMHWNGDSWSVVHSPNVGPRDNVLYSVSAVPGGDVWATGQRARRSLGLRWDAHSWTVDDTPNPGTKWDILLGVHARSNNDVWAVGWQHSGGRPDTLTLHRGRRGWKAVPSPDLGRFTDALNAVDATSATDVWAVGEFYKPVDHGSTILHFC